MTQPDTTAPEVKLLFDTVDLLTAAHPGWEVSVTEPAGTGIKVSGYVTEETLTGELTVAVSVLYTVTDPATFPFQVVAEARQRTWDALVGKLGVHCWRQTQSPLMGTPERTVASDLWLVYVTAAKAWLP